MYLKRHEVEYMRDVAEKLLEYKKFKEMGETLLSIVESLENQRDTYNKYMHMYLTSRAFKKEDK